MSDSLGVVTGINRTNRRVGAVLDDGITIPVQSGLTYRGNPPPPLSRCWFPELDTGRRICDGPVGNGRVIVHDDFLIATLAANYGDTAWRQLGTLGTIAQPAAPTGQGAARLNTSAAALTHLTLAKDSAGVLPPTSPTALWCSFSMQTESTSQIMVHAGLLSDGLLTFQNVAGNAGVYLYFDPTGIGTTQWYARTAVGVNESTIPLPASGQGPIVFDLVYCAGSFAAFWADGDGPYVITANVPGTTNGLEPMLGVQGRTSAQQAIQCDWFHLEQIGIVPDPGSVVRARNTGGVGSWAGAGASLGSQVLFYNVGYYDSGYVWG